MLPIPAEAAIFGTYVPPLLLCVILGALAMVVTVRLLNKYRLSRYFNFPNLVMLAITAIYTVFFATFVIPT